MVSEVPKRSEQSQPLHNEDKPVHSEKIKEGDERRKNESMELASPIL